MVGPSPDRGRCVDDKTTLRARLRNLRRTHVSELPASMHALLFLRPPSPLVALAPEGATVGLYHATPLEAPSRSYAKFFLEHGRTLALPRFADRQAPMEFRAWTDPFADADLETGPFGIPQPREDAPPVLPSMVFVPLIGFTADGLRLGQGGGHYDRWLAAHPGVVAVGMGWDCQLLEGLPAEPHDMRLDAVVTPTRLYGDL